MRELPWQWLSYLVCKPYIDIRLLTVPQTVYIHDRHAQKCRTAIYMVRWWQRNTFCIGGPLWRESARPVICNQLFQFHFHKYFITKWRYLHFVLLSNLKTSCSSVLLLQTQRKYSIQHYLMCHRYLFFWYGWPRATTCLHVNYGEDSWW